MFFLHREVHFFLPENKESVSKFGIRSRSAPAQFRHSGSSLFNRKQRTRLSRSNHPPTPGILRLYSIADRTDRFLCCRFFNLFVFIIFFFVRYRYLTTPAAPARLSLYITTTAVKRSILLRVASLAALRLKVQLLILGRIISASLTSPPRRPNQR